jgi:Rhodopirellula transposase DDE domain
MPRPHSNQCRCALCLYEAAHQDKDHHREVMAFLATLNREQRRLYAAIESHRLGPGGVAKVAETMGLCKPTIARGRRDLLGLLQGQSLKKERKPVSGRPRKEETTPELKAALEEMLSDEVAGSPEGEKRWVRSSVRKLTSRLRERGFSVGHMTVWALLKRMDFSLKTSVRKRRGICRDPERRDEQFPYIASQRKEFCDKGLPVISVDAKKTEMIGNFKPRGRKWCKKAPEVNEYNLPSLAEYIAIPFGIYDVLKNTGYVVVGLSHNTPEFAVSSIVRWWNGEGIVTYPESHQLLILADGGGSNGSRARAWKWNLQEKLCNPYHLTVTVCHYPPGCSKWNPVEYRLFSQISNNWEGEPLRTLEVMLGFIRGTTTTTGLTVKAFLDEGTYPKGQKVSWKDVDDLNLTPHEVCPEWNYTIRPSK